MTEFLSVFDTGTQEILKEKTSLPLLRRLPLLYNAAVVARTIGTIELSGLQHRSNSQAEQDIIGILHGDQVRTLGDKSQFPHVLRSLGYTAPDSVLISSFTPEEERIEHVKSYYLDKGIDRVFCKPLNGSRQRDLHDFEMGSVDLNTYLLRIDEDIVVQEFMPHERVLRYIRYRDNEGKVYVGCFTYKDTMPQNSRNIPLIGNIHLSFSGETLNEFLQSIRNTDIEVFPDTNRLQNLNRFMDNAISQLSTHLEQELPFFTCDIGIARVSELEGEYEEERLKKNVVFFETQALPNPWAPIKIRNRNLATYATIWRLYFDEHSKDITHRARKFRRLHVPVTN